MSNEHMIAVVNGYMDAFEHKDISIIRNMYAADAVVEDPVGSEPHEGIDAILGFYEGALAMGPKLALTGPVRCAGSSAAFPFQVSMGDMTMDIIDVFDFDDQGKVKHMRAYWGPDNTNQG
jgi:steroid delta-isomerase